MFIRLTKVSGRKIYVNMQKCTVFQKEGDKTILHIENDTVVVTESPEDIYHELYLREIQHT